MNGDHYGDLSGRGAKPFVTPCWQAADLRVAEALAGSVAAPSQRPSRILLVAGEVGAGKSFAVRRVCETNAQQNGSQFIWVENNPSPEIKDTVRNLGAALGFEFKGTAAQLSAQVNRALIAQGTTIVVVDEVQYMTRKAVAQLRWMNEAAGAGWLLVLIGGPGFGRLMDTLPEIKSRARATILFEPMDSDDVVDALRRWHPAWKKVNATVIQRINTRWAHGNWRRWAKILDVALFYAEGTDTPNDITDVLDAALEAARDSETAILP